MLYQLSKFSERKFLGGPVISRLSLPGPKFDPWSGNEDLASWVAGPKKLSKMHIYVREKKVFLSPSSFFRLL